MKERDLKLRTKRLALDVIDLFEVLPKDETSRVLGWQLLRAGTSVGANYRAAKRAKSNADFISKMGNVEEEADECGYWLELLIEKGKVKPRRPRHFSVNQKNSLQSPWLRSTRPESQEIGKAEFPPMRFLHKSRLTDSELVRLSAFRVPRSAFL